MERNLQIFSNPQFGEIRTVINCLGEIEFCAADVCKALGYANPRKAVADHADEGDVTKRDMGVATGKKADGTDAVQVVSLTFINESGLYSLIFGSKLDSAKSFKKWVTSEVLPSIRKHGMYATPKKLEELIANPDLVIAYATQVKEERAKRIEAEVKYLETEARRIEAESVAKQRQKTIEMQEETITKQAPKVEYHDKVLSSQSTFTVTEIAAFYGHSAKWLNDKLHKLGIQYKLGKMWHLYEKYKDKGLSKPTVYPYTGSDGLVKTNEQMEWTEKGREFIHRMLTDNNLIINRKEASYAAN